MSARTPEEAGYIVDLALYRIEWDAEGEAYPREHVTSTEVGTAMGLEEANRLVDLHAAAPAMLAALERILADHYQPDGPAREQGQAAIAKAKGEA